MPRSPASKPTHPALNATSQFPRLALAAALLLAAGCESVDGPGASLARAFSVGNHAKLEDEHRRTFQETGDSAAVRWLLAHRVSNGMPLEDVRTVLGHDGERVHNDQWIKTEGTGLLRTDTVYKWGPDSLGQSYYLAFRDGRLTNFNRSDYEVD